MRVILMGHAMRHVRPILKHMRRNDYEVTVYERQDDWDGAVALVEKYEPTVCILFAYGEAFEHVLARMAKLACVESGKTAILPYMRWWDEGVLERMSWEPFPHIMFLAEHIRQKAVAAGVPESRTSVVRHGVELYKYWIDDEPKPHKPLAVAWVARLWPRKGVPLLFALADRLHTGLAAQTHMVAYRGQKPLSVDLNNYFDEQLAARPYMHYTRSVQNDMVGAFMADKDVIASTSFREVTQNAVLEGMAMGLKPLVHRWPHADELVPEEFLWYTLDEAVEIARRPCEPERYRQYVADEFSSEAQMRGIDAGIAAALGGSA